MQGERYFFVFFGGFKTRNSVLLGGMGDVGKVGRIGIEGNRERIHIKTIVHQEGKDE